MENDVVICNCNEIYKSAIVKAIREHGISIFLLYIIK